MSNITKEYIGKYATKDLNELFCYIEELDIPKNADTIQTSLMLIDYNISMDVIKSVLRYSCKEPITDVDFIIDECLNYQFDNLIDNNYEDYRYMLVLKAIDYEITIALIIHRLILMRKYKKQEVDNKKDFALISLNIYSPLAHRLGLYAIKTELEELSLYFLDLDGFKKIVKSVELKKHERISQLNSMTEKIESIVKDSIENVTIYGRSKNIYSIYKKMIEKNKTIEDLYDLYAIRIICDDVIQCYSILGILHNYFVPVENRFKDYIAIKKSNLYQSLHTAIFGIGNQIFEVQIRTRKMDEIAEHGIAAHWAYKEGETKNQKYIQEQLSLFKDLENNKNSVDELTSSNIDSKIYVFTPTGKIIFLPKNSIIIDFAYAIHSKVAENMIGATINGNIAKITDILKNEDIVNIKTTAHGSATHKDWLDVVKTDKARKKIKSNLRKQIEVSRVDEIEIGKEIFENIVKNLKLNIDELNKESTMNRLMKHYSFVRISEFYISVANKNITENMIEEFFTLKPRTLKLVKVKEVNLKDSVTVVGAEGIKKEIAKCCSPIPGDIVVGVIVTGVGIKIHNVNCNNIKRNLNSRLVEAKWNEEHLSQSKYGVNLRIISTNRDNLLTDIIASIGKSHVGIEQIESKAIGIDVITKIRITIENTEKLDNIINSINSLKGIQQVDRIFK